MLQLFQNFSKGRLASTLSSTETAIDLQPTHGTRFPNVPFACVIWNSTDYPDAADAYWGGAAEIILCHTTNPTAAQFPIVQRAFDSTTALNFTDDSKIYSIMLVVNSDFFTRTIRRDKDSNNVDILPGGSNGLQILSTGEVSLGVPPATPASGIALTVAGGIDISSGALRLEVGPSLVPTGSAPSQSVTVTSNCHAIDTSSASASVSEILGGQDGQLLFINPSSGSNDLTLSQGGNLKLSGNVDQVLIQNADMWCGLYRGTTWRQVSAGINNQ